MSAPNEWIILTGARRSSRAAREATFGTTPLDDSTGAIAAIVVDAVVTAAMSGHKLWFTTGGMLASPPWRGTVADIDIAMLEATELKTRSLSLRFGVNGGPEFTIRLTDGDTRLIDEGTRAALLEILRASSIRMPVDRFDPKGKFASSGFPSHLTREQAIAIVDNPPGASDKLPILRPLRAIW